MFNTVAPRYDLMNDLLTMGIARSWRRHTVRAIDPQPGQLILDLAGGTGTSAVALARQGAQVVPADISLGMVIEGKRRHPQLSFVNADALALPFADDSFDTVTISFGLRNVEDTLAGLLEMARVTRPGGRLVICEFSRPTWGPFRAAYRLYLSQVLSRLARFGSNPESYSYLVESILEWPDQEQLAALLSQAGWRQVAWQDLAGGIVSLHRAVAP